MNISVICFALQLKQIKRRPGNMKKAVLFFSLFLFVLVALVNVGAQESKPPADADNNRQALIDTRDMRYEKSPINKLGRGLINTVTCLIETPAGVYRVSSTKGAIVGWTLGLAEGLFTSLLRGASGILDVVTCVVPPYNKPLMQPEYAIDSFEESYRDLGEAEMEIPDL